MEGFKSSTSLILNKFATFSSRSRRKLSRRYRFVAGGCGRGFDGNSMMSLCVSSCFCFSSLSISPRKRCTLLYKMSRTTIFQASGAILSQMAPFGSTAAALNKCLRQVRMLDDAVQCCNARFWDVVLGSIIGTLLVQVKEEADEQSILRTVHSIYDDIGVKDLTVEIEIYEK